VVAKGVCAGCVGKAVSFDDEAAGRCLFAKLRRFSLSIYTACLEPKS
jgi:hypothetical protein